MHRWLSILPVEKQIANNPTNTSCPIFMKNFKKLICHERQADHCVFIGKKKLIVKRKVGSLFWMDSPMDNYKMLSVGCSNFPFSFNRKKDP